jgi:hypothetical protein
MPIEVHCPNPECAKVHLVKDKYAGMRGKCPACSSWMYVPKTAVPTMVVPRPEALEEAAWKSPELAAAAPAQTTVGPRPQEAAEPVETLPIVQREERVQPEARSAARAEVDEEPVEVQPDAEKSKPKKYFSWLAAVLLLLGIVSLGLISATPFLAVGKINATGDFVEYYGAREGEGIKPDMKMYVMTVPAGGAALVFIALLAGFIAGRFGFPSLFLVYLTGVLSVALLFLTLHEFRRQSMDWAKIVERVEHAKSQGRQGDVNPSLGQFLWAALGGSAGACLSMIFAAVLMHRRWWSRVFAFLFLGGMAALAAVWVYREELGIQWLDQYLPALPF